MSHQKYWVAGIARVGHPPLDITEKAVMRGSELKTNHPALENKLTKLPTSPITQKNENISHPDGMKKKDNSIG